LNRRLKPAERSPAAPDDGVAGLLVLSTTGLTILKGILVWNLASLAIPGVDPGGSFVGWTTPALF